MEENISGLASRIGSRFACDGHFGTVRYIGEVQPTNGLWLGVEWDEPCRGIHNGDHEGTRYFTCSVKDAGSFLRPRKVNLGTSFTQAVQERYGDGEMCKVDLYVDVKPVEMVGWDKLAKLQSSLDQLREVSLRGMFVASAGPPGDVEKTTPNIIRLDLSQNHLLSSLDSIIDIVSQLKSLITLQLSGIKYLSIPSHPLVHATPFLSLRSLFINKMNLTWSKVSTILQLTPILEELHACENKIDSISSNHDCLPPSLTLLNLEENQLSDWSAVLGFKNIQKLRTLILNDNMFASLCVTGGQMSPGDFSSLESLSLRGNMISNWASVNFLAQFPSITNMKFQGNPLMKDYPVLVGRQLFISRMGNLTCLNNSLITKRERHLAEQYYLKHYAVEFTDSKSSESLRLQFLDLHPRFLHLISVHGFPDEVNELSRRQVVSSLKDGLISVTIKHPSDPHKELTKKVPVTMTVQKLKGLIQRLYHVDTSILKLSYLDKEGRNEIEMADNLKQLAFYSIEEGAKIILK